MLLLWQTAILKILVSHIYCIIVILWIVLVLNFINQCNFPFFWVVEHGNEYETIKYKNEIKLKNFQPKIIFLRTKTYTLIMPINAEYLSHERWVSK